jgi:PAS domain S-box-containing protein
MKNVLKKDKSNSIDELKARIKILEEENSGLAEQAEDLFSHSLITEVLDHNSNITKVIENVLERLAIIHSLSYSAFCKLEKDKLIPVFTYIEKFSEDSVEQTLKVKKQILSDLFYSGKAISTTSLKGLSIELLHGKKSLKLTSALLFNSHTRYLENGVFVFAFSNSVNQFLNKQVIFQDLVNSVNERLNYLMLVEELKEVNLELEKKISERTRELLETNQKLESEIKIRHIKQKELEQSDLRYQEIFENIPDGIYRSTPEGRILSLNPALVRSLGFNTEQEVLNLNVERNFYVNPGDRKKFIDELNKKGEIHNCEISLYRKDGSICYFLDNSHAVKDDSGKVLYYEGTLTDISERKLALEKIAKSELEFRTVWESSPSGMRITDEFGTVIKVNDAYCKIFGMSKNELELKPFTIIYPEPKQENFAKEYQVKFKTKTFEKSFDRELELWNGTKIWLEVSSSFLEIEGQKPLLFSLFTDISNLKKAEAEKILSEKRYREVIENAEEIIFTTDNRGYFTYVNSAGLKASGYELDELLKIKYADLITPDYKNIVSRNYFRQFVGRIDLTTTEYPFCTKSGEVKWFNQNARLIIEHNEPIGFYIIARDVTEKRKVSEALQRSEEKFNKAFNLTPVAMSLQRGDIFIDVNEAFVKLTGYTPEETIGKHADKLNLWADSTERELANQFFFNKNSLNDFEFIIRKKNGDLIHALMYAEKVEIDKKQHVLTAAVDISDRKKTGEALRQSEKKFSTFFKSSPLALAITRVKDNALIDVNSAWEKLTGYKADEVIGRTTNDFNLWESPELRDVFIQNLAEQGSAQEIELKLIQKSGSVVDLLFTAAKIELNDELFIISMAQDITEKKKSALEVLNLKNTYKELYDDAPFGYHELDSDGKYSRVNKTLCSMLGFSEEELLGKYVWDNVQDKDASKERVLKKLSGKLEVSDNVERVFVKKNGELFNVLIQDKLLLDNNRKIIGIRTVSQDITERKKYEEIQKLTAEILHRSNIRGNTYSLIADIIDLVKKSFNYDAIGLRLKEGDDYPYYEQIGFSETFIKRENSLCTYLEDGKIRRDENGKPILECTCGLIISGKSDPSLPNFTEGGSYWTNQSDELLDLPANLDPRNYPRNLCIKTGYQSVAIIPLRSENEIIGTLQLNDKRPGQFTPQLIDFFEGLVNTISIALKRKQMEESLKESESRNKIVTEMTADYVFIVDVQNGNLKLRWASENLFPQTGRELDEISDYEKWRSIIYHEDREKFFDFIQDSLKSDKSSEIELRSYVKTNKLRWVNVVVKPQLESGQVVSIIGAVKDISERKKAEEETLRRLNELITLQKASSAFGQSLKPEDVGFTIVDTLERLMAWERGSIWLKDKSGDNLILLAHSKMGLNEHEFKIECARVNNIVKKVGEGIVGWVTKTGETIRSGNIRTNEHYLIADEKVKSEMCVPLFIGGEIIGSINAESYMPDAFTEHDERLMKTIANQAAVAIKNAQLFEALQQELSERMKTEIELIAAKEKAEEMNRVKSYFYANMSHEMRTPFVGILGLSEILMDNLEDQDQKRMAEGIYKSSKRFIDTLNKILTVTKLELSKPEVVFSGVNVEELLIEINELFGATAEQKGIFLKLNILQKIPWIKTDETLLREILLNLVNNAIKFTKTGGVTVSVKINYQQNKILFDISDTGIGIPLNKQQIIWQEFRQVSEGLNRSFEGTGLGLTITKRYTELLGGTISLISEEFKGSTFSVEIPFIEWTSEMIDEKYKPYIVEKKKIEPIENKSKKRILYVEDDENARDVVSRWLSKLYFIDLAKDADSAIYFTSNYTYDAILMDINLGRGKDGLDLAAKIRESEKFQNLPIIAITAYAEAKDKEELLTKGMNYYLSKPFSSEQLLSLLSEMFN